MRPAPIIVRVWDCGWLRRDEVILPPCSSDATLIEHYISSPAFHTSFISSDKNENEIHGPFVAARIHADDFIPLQQSRLEDYLKSVEISESSDENLAAHREILPHLRGAFEMHGKCYVLKRNERDKDLFHDWGFVLWVFREFLFVKQGCDRLERFVIGYD